MNRQQPNEDEGVSSVVVPFIDADATRRHIADELVRARLAHGLEIVDVSSALRIRAVYLEALEEGRFDDLPGPTYVAGFLRSYGNYLGLDGQDLVRRFKDENGGTLVPQELSFPALPSEARRPTAFISGAALIVAVALVGAWYVLEEAGQFGMERVEEVPAELAADARAAPTPSAQPTPSAEAGPVGEPMAADESPATAAGPSAGDATVEPPLEAPPAAALAAARTEPAAETGEVESGSDDAGDGISDDNGYVPRVYGRTHADSRVEIKAVAETWIQVESAGGEVLITRILLPGDIYRVPNRDDVTLDSGNAGGLELRLDGALLSSLGRQGVVVRGVSLAPEALLER